ncbi:ribbon-helix-helix domain-containing protein [Candidatus Pacearchaeota archaeon]|nr:ribbon-helix-helix domain-containing protein [Candidatus Pacearchaeota archaeon]
MKENPDINEIFQHYDKTREFLIGRKRIDITLDKRIIKKLREISIKEKKPISRIIEEAIKDKLFKISLT